MIKIQAGDKVKRILGEHIGMKVGDVGTVESIENEDTEEVVVFLKEWRVTGSRADGMDPVNLIKIS